jgi:hypothetical protein
LVGYKINLKILRWYEDRVGFVRLELMNERKIVLLRGSGHHLWQHFLESG